MDCKVCMDRASEYIEGGLSLQERSEMQAHFDTCSSCAETVGGVSRIVDSLRTLRRITPSVAFDFVLRGVIRRELYKSRHRRSSTLRWLVPERGFPLPVALFAALMVFSSVFAIDGLWQSLSARRTADRAEILLNSRLASGENVTNHYVLERTTLEALRADAGDSTAAAGMNHTFIDTSLFVADDWQGVGIDRVKLVTF